MRLISQNKYVDVPYESIILTIDFEDVIAKNDIYRILALRNVQTS